MTTVTKVRFRCNACWHITEFDMAVTDPADVAPPDECPNCGKGGPNQLNKQGVWDAGRIWRGKSGPKEVSTAPPFRPYDYA